MNERARLVGVLFLGVISLCLSIHIVIATYLGIEIRPAVWSMLGVCVGCLAGLIPADTQQKK